MLRFQVRCKYCNRPLSQTEEKRLGKISLCEDCFKFIVRADSSAVPSTHSDAFSSANLLAFSKRKRSTFTMHFLKQNDSFSPAFSFRDSPQLPLDVRLNILRFYRRLRT